MLYLDKKPVELHFFPNRELYFDTPVVEGDRDANHVIDLRFEGSDDLIALRFLKMSLEDRGYTNLTLFIPFFPYSTMDHSDGSRPLSLKYMAAEINALGFRRVEVLEPHSDTLAAVVDRLVVIPYSVALAHEVIAKEGIEKPLICFPDGGAEKRYSSGFSGYKIATFQKERDFATGQIIAMRPTVTLFYGAHDTAIIVDDLCRGGRTFLECAKLLRTTGVKRILLCVTHIEGGIFSGGLLDSGMVDGVYATDSCLPQNKEKHPKLFLVSASDREV